MSASMSVEGFALGGWQTNCYVISSPGDKRCWIIDTPPDPQTVIRTLQKRALVPQALVYTHAHLDHIAGMPEFLSAFGDLPRLAHRAEADWYGDPMLNLSALSGEPVSVLAPTAELVPGSSLQMFGEWQVWHTPGHSPGGVTIVNHEARIALVGDTLFAGSIGRVDLPGADPRQMGHSLKVLLMSLPDDFQVLPGHGPATTIGRERASNPFLQDGADQELYG